MPFTLPYRGVAGKIGINSPTGSQPGRAPDSPERSRGPLLGSGDGFACDQSRPEGLVPGDWGTDLGDFELHGREIRRLSLLPPRDVHGAGECGLDVQDCQTNSVGEKVKMTTLASMSGFFGTIWFMALMCVASFGAGVIFKDHFLKMVTGGRWQK